MRVEIIRAESKVRQDERDRFDPAPGALGAARLVGVTAPGGLLAAQLDADG